MPDPFDLTGRIALVTGASRGLGLQFARALARAGADLAITSRSLESLAAATDEIAALGRRVFPVALEVREQASIQHAVAQALDHFGHIDILVNNAGCNIRKPALDVTWDDWSTIVDTNLRGAFFVAQALARQMIPRRWGRVVNIGSVTSVAGYAGLAPYGASRGGIKQLTMSLAHDWGPHGITVNCLAPGWFKTEQNRALYEDPGWVEYLCERIPLGRPGQAGDLDGALLLLASDAGRYITGQTLLVDGGISIGAVRALLDAAGAPRRPHRPATMDCDFTRASSRRRSTTVTESATTPGSARRRFCFSLRTLLLAVVAVSVGISYWLKQREVTETRAALISLRNDVGELSIDDPSRLHIIALPTYENMASRWRIHVPEDRQYMLYYVIGTIPASGLPDRNTASFMRERLPAGRSVLGVALDRTPSGTPQLVLDVDGQVSQSFSRDAMAWIEPNTIYDLDPPGRGQTLSADPRTPLVLLRLRKPKREGRRTINDPKPTDGILVWIEEAP